MTKNSHFENLKIVFKFTGATHVVFVGWTTMHTCRSGGTFTSIRYFLQKTTHINDLKNDSKMHDETKKRWHERINWKRVKKKISFWDLLKLLIYLKIVFISVGIFERQTYKRERKIKNGFVHKISRLIEKACRGQNVFDYFFSLFNWIDKPYTVWVIIKRFQCSRNSVGFEKKWPLDSDWKRPFFISLLHLQTIETPLNRLIAREFKHQFWIEGDANLLTVAKF